MRVAQCVVVMSEELLNWRAALASVAYAEQEYGKKLRSFIANERDCAEYVATWIRQGKNAEAVEKVHAIKLMATEFGAKRLANAAFSLEMAIKAGADTAASLNHFDSVLMDTLLAMSTYLAS